MEQKKVDMKSERYNSKEKNYKREDLQNKDFPKVEGIMKNNLITQKSSGHNTLTNSNNKTNIVENKIKAYKKMFKSKKFITRINVLRILKRKEEYAKILINEIIDLIDDEHSTVSQFAQDIVKENATENEIEKLNKKKEIEPKLTSIIDQIIKKIEEKKQ